MDDKKMVRQRVRTQRDALSEAAIAEKSAAIAARVLRLPAFARANTLFTYYNKTSEVTTGALIRAAWRLGKRTALPVTTPGDPDMRFVFIDRLDNLVKSRFGVWEPDGGATVVPDNRTLLVVPGLVFDRHKNRVGYGGGYYDRFMAKNTVMAKIGLCYNCQLVDDVCPEPWDIPMDQIITETVTFT